MFYQVVFLNCAHVVSWSHGVPARVSLDFFSNYFKLLCVLFKHNGLDIFLEKKTVRYGARKVLPGDRDGGSTSPLNLVTSDPESGVSVNKQDD